MTIEDMEAEIRETTAMIRRRRRMGTGLLSMPLVLLMCLVVTPVGGFTAYDCSNRSNVVESYSLLEPDACANMGRDGEVETTVYDEIVQIKQDWMIPVFRCVVVETLGGSTVLRDFLSSRSYPVHQVQGAQAARSLGVPESETEQPAHHQRADCPGQDRSDGLPHHVPVWRPRR